MFTVPLSHTRIKRIIIVLTAVIIFAGYKIYNITRKPETQLVAVYAVKAKKQDIPIVIKEVGKAVANQSVAIKSRIDSQITEVLFKDGDKVLKDSVLLKLDDRTIKANLAQLEANLNKDLTQLGFFEREYNRKLAIYSSGFQTEKDLDNSKNNYEAQKAEVEVTKATVENAKVMLDYTVIKAPITGRAGISLLTAGNTVKANDSQPILVINQIDPIKVQFSVAQKDYLKLRTAKRNGEINISIDIPDSGETLNGRLSSLENTFDSNGNFSVQAIVDNKDEKLWPGMYVTVAIDMGKEKEAVTIPANSVQMGQDQEYVYVIDGDVAKRKNVTVKYTVMDTAIISQGISEDDMVIMDGFLKIKDGASVKVIEK